MSHELTPIGLLRITRGVELRTGPADHCDSFLATSGARIVFYPTEQCHLPDYLSVVVFEEGRLPLPCVLPFPGVLALLSQEVERAIRAREAYPSGTLSSQRDQLISHLPLVSVEMTIAALLSPEIAMKLGEVHKTKLYELQEMVVSDQL